MHEQTVISVGMADLSVANGRAIIRTPGLGSCVGLTLHDPRMLVGGMVHIMLPNSEIAKGKELNHAKYADTAVPRLINKMQEAGANISRLEAKMAGGAQMFSFSDHMRIGARNAEACLEWLQHYKIPLISQDIGGNHGRTIELHCQTGALTIRSVKMEAKEI